MADKSPSDKNKTTDRRGASFKNVRFSGRQLTTFGLIFAVVGGFILWRAFAAFPPEVQINANPTVITLGQNTTITWSTVNVTSCTASGDWSGSKSASGGSQLVTPSGRTGTFTYAISCSGPNGSAQDSVNVMVNPPPPPPPPPTVSLAANPAFVAYGGASTLNWSSTNATSCTASGAWSGAKPTSGSQSTGSLNSTRTYTLTCSGAGGSASHSATVGVGARPHPTVNLVANPSSIAYNGYSFLQWTSTNADRCSANWTGSTATSGTQRVGRLTTTTTYSITCYGNGSASDSATVTVGRPPANCPPLCPQPPPPPTPRPLPPPAGEPPAPSPQPQTESPSPESISPEEISPTPEFTSPPKCSQNHLLNILTGGLIGELIKLIKGCK